MKENSLQGETVTYWAVIWSIVSLGCYLTFSVVEPGDTRPLWFILTTTGLEEIGLMVSGYLCWRNWRSQHIPSGRVVWLLLAIAIFAFFVGNLWFCVWEVLWGLDPAASAGNPCFVIFYLMLIAGVRLAILDRDVRLARPQWAIVLSVATFGLIIGCWLTTSTVRAEALPPPSMPMLETKGYANESPPGLKSSMTDDLAQIHPSVVKQISAPPEWVLAIDRQMQPLVKTFNLFYVLCDVILLILATILYLGFWGGSLGATWQTIAQGVLCFYIADTWFTSAADRMQGYESGSIMEVFWIFGIVQFGIAAQLEFDNSIRARRLARRRTVNN
jgi:hypothetical protein